VLEVEEDPRFVRDGADLVHELGVTFSQAALGAEVDVPLIGAASRVRIAPGTQSGHLMRLRGKGLPNLRGGTRGDLIVRVVVWTPTRLTAEQEQVLRELAAVEEAVPSERSRETDRGLWSRLKEAFGG
jgi:molecular chaperone DnaJ